MKLYKYVTYERIDILIDGLIRFTQPKQLNDPFELPLIIEFSKKNNVEAYQSAIAASIYFRISIGFLSLTTRPDNLLMWSHYANRHKGFLIELDSENRFFRTKKSMNKDLGLHEVVYQTKPPTFKSVESVFDNASPLLYSKEVGWEYEQEWRMTKYLSSADKVIKQFEQFGGDVYLFKLPATCIKSIIIGCEMPRERRNRIKDIIQTNNRFKNVKLFQAYMDKQSYILKIRAVEELSL